MVKWYKRRYVDANFNLPDGCIKPKLEFYGTKGTIFAQSTLSQVEGGEVEVLCVAENSAYDASQNRETVSPLEIEVEFGNMYTKEIEAFGRAINGEQEIPVCAADAIMSQKVVEATYQSSKTKKYVTL